MICFQSENYGGNANGKGAEQGQLYWNKRIWLTYKKESKSEQKRIDGFDEEK